MMQSLSKIPDIIILMSTYNGEKYVADQIDSILNQQGVSFYLLIRDDGSTDSTVSILQEYINKHPDTIELIKGKNVGWMESFRLLSEYASSKFVESNYFCFSDQDDIWLPQKLQRAIDSLKTLPSGPNLYCSNLFYFENGENKGLVRQKKVNTSPSKSIIRNYATGCTVVFNKDLLDLFTKERPHIPVPHDYWAFLLANFLGNIFVDHDSFILYRQHRNNQIGSKKTTISIWKRRLTSLSKLTSSLNKELLARELMRIFEHDMSKENKSILLKIINYRTSFLNRLSLIFDKNYTYDNISNDFWLKLRILFGKL